MASRDTITALHEALDDEYRARATYRAVIAAFGAVRPFVNIADAEERHIAALLAQFDRLGVAAPHDKWQERVPAPASVTEACKTGIEAEIENAAMYDRLLTKVDDPIVRRVMRRLQAASKERHLPAFQRCAVRQGGSPHGRGRQFRGRRSA